MTYKKFTFLLLLFSITNIFAQDIVLHDSIKKPELKLSFLDSLKTTYVIDEMSACVDEKCFKELTNEDISKELLADLKNINLDEKVDFELSTELLKERLRLMDEKSPFNIEYNVGLENIIKSFLKNRKRSFQRLLGISQYYFPMFEEAMAKYNVPLEIKYLAIVESALNPKAVSRVGATGLWQFMYQTGKQYKLRVNSYIDERSDALKASEAAAQYMSNMYKIFGDWELVLASYNSGAGNVTKAIRRSGGHQNFWNIKKFLPRETAAYVPMFLATMYIFEYHKEHGIMPEKAIANHFATDTIAIKSKMSFKQISQLLDMPEAQIEFLNPSYKMKVIPYVTNETHFLCLPKDKIAIFASNEDKMYAYVNYEEKNRERPFAEKPKAKIMNNSITQNNEVAEVLVETKTIIKNVSKTKFYKVKSGDNLSDIARKYNIAMSDLKKWNHLKSNNVQLGKSLKIIIDERIAVVQKVKKPTLDANLELKSESTVDKTVAVLDKPVSKKEIIRKEKMAKADAVLEKTAVVLDHIVKQGETLSSIAKENKLYVADLKKWNNLKDANIKLGDKLKLSNATSLAIANEVVKPSTETAFYTIKKGDNISLIAKKNDVTIDDLKQWNDLEDNVIKVGTKLKIEKVLEVVAEVSKKETKKKSKYEEQKLYVVQKGDSLFSISKKHNTTVAYIKKLNDIKDENLQPGMKLKIKG
ncbi:TPA: LysM peptidoglycan-binding domain-containing protein [Flavobacterium psychrophilum]|uniref:LysM peptidoglycan-binding domain-containing protein n=1 Tax=Flavobacterium psychrophilum TaxID=96345 RepID=UPI00073F52A2|nr:LysM peptidoglycan-binding domain-containing protein [Flavobacterium psychrophilum]SNB97732.1 Membrane-bound lytic murein transglycosylase D [Flavobacterium psychrophilum]GAQ49312.1 lytic transglycosylase [Flavobacterium psychrophilum]GAW89318.1 lytic transglycosylase [Flavobacterium psychrophilum]GEJ29702.1 lytic transglycosylase [Flavobacterium psychrophilum]GEJ35541.1 lytic transglycosylase [Flavobacterium psychrophilum]